MPAKATESLRAALYTRVSLDRRDTGRSVGEQEAELRETARREGWQVVGDVLTDNDRSASRYARKARPAYDRLVELVTRSGCDVVAVWELSRLSRDLGTLVHLRDLCRDRGIRWSVGGRMYDPADDRDTMPIIFEACRAEGESASTSKRVRRAMTATAQAGRPHGRTTYGYRREYDPDTRAFVAQVVDDDQAAILHEIADRFLSGEAFYAIARDLTARGIPTPATVAGSANAGPTWHATNCARLMRNAAYVGRRIHAGQWVADAVWPAIFTDEQWNLMQAKLTDPARRSTRETARKHLLTGIAFCGVCGTRHRMGLTKQRGAYRAYLCQHCFKVARRQDVVDAHVVAKIIERLAAPDLADLYGRAEQDSAAAASAARQRVAELRARLTEFEDEAVSGKISAAVFGRLESRLTAELEAAELDAQRAALPPGVRHLAGLDADRVRAIWDALTIGEQRDVIRALGARITINPTGKGRRTFDPDAVPVEFVDPVTT